MEVLNTLKDQVVGKVNGLATKDQLKLEKEPYKVEPTNWYKSMPYGFEFFNRAANSDGNSVKFYLPISPNNIQVTTHFATNVVTTLYGVVEEHSEVRYYDITISGTTGIVPRFVDQFSAKTKNGTNISTGRSHFVGEAGLNLGGFLPEVTNIISQVKGVISDIQDSLNGGPQNETGVDPAKTGYLAFHNLYKFFLKYKADAAGMGVEKNNPRSKHPIQFLNYKDGIKYDCIPLKFNLVRSADNPMLYNYSIQLKCFNLRDVNSKPLASSGMTEKLGLGGIKGQSVFSRLNGAASNAATLISGLL